MDSKGKVAVVTGGNSGLGEATAQALLAAGAKVVSFDLSGSAPDGADFIQCDVTDPAAVKAAVDQVIRQHGAVHILANCAGIGGLGPIASADGPGDVAAFRKVIDVNLLGAVAVTAEVAHRMTANDPSGPDGERGVIINACSIASFQGQEGMGAYTASKAALAAMTLVWTRDLSKYAIRCMGIAPGLMATPMVAGIPQDLMDEMLKNSEFPNRSGSAEEYAKVVMFILENTLLNGDIIRLDAGTRPPARTQWSLS